MAGEYAYTNGTPETSHCNLAEFKTLCALSLSLSLSLWYVFGRDISARGMNKWFFVGDSEMSSPRPLQSPCMKTDSIPNGNPPRLSPELFHPPRVLTSDSE